VSILDTPAKEVSAKTIELRKVVVVRHNVHALQNWPFLAECVFFGKYVCGGPGADTRVTPGPCRRDGLQPLHIAHWPV
jgi:hypothetical protein